MITPTIVRSLVKLMISMFALHHILTIPDLELGPSDETYDAFWDWVTSFNAIFSGCIYLTTTFMSLYRCYNTPLCVCTMFSLPICHLKDIEAGSVS